MIADSDLDAPGFDRNVQVRIDLGKAVEGCREQRIDIRIVDRARLDLAVAVYEHGVHRADVEAIDDDWMKPRIRGRRAVI